MARIAGVDLPPAKRAEIGLTYIYGVGRTRSKSLLHRAGINFDKKVRDLTEDVLKLGLTVNFMGVPSKQRPDEFRAETITIGNRTTELR